MLIVEDDLGFVFWLGNLLDGEGYAALPAKNVADAAQLIAQLDLIVDLLIINLDVARANEFIAGMHSRNDRCKVIGMLQDPMQNPYIPGVSAIAPYRPENLDASARAEWLQCIKQVLTNTAQARS